MEIPVVAIDRGLACAGGLGQLGWSFTLHSCAGAMARRPSEAKRKKLGTLLAPVPGRSFDPCHNRFLAGYVDWPAFSDRLSDLRAQLVSAAHGSVWLSNSLKTAV
jgi:hypothetical protein